MVGTKRFLDLYFNGRSARLHKALARTKARDPLGLTESVRAGLERAHCVGFSPEEVIVWLERTDPTDQYFDCRYHLEEGISVDEATEVLVRSVQKQRNPFHGILKDLRKRNGELDGDRVFGAMVIFILGGSFLTMFLGLIINALKG
ncbi:MAG: hypothetical protein ABEK59_09290 [Halobacteria archaeon]